MNLRANCSKKASPELCDWNAFRIDDNLQKQYAIEVKNRYDVLLNEEVSATPSDRYTLFEKANTFAKELLIPKKVKTKRSVSQMIHVFRKLEVKLKSPTLHSLTT